MAELSGDAIRAVLARVRALASAARRSCADMLAELLSREGMTVARAREGAKAVMEAVAGRYAPAAAEAATLLYDLVMEAEGVGVPPADPHGGVDPGQVDSVARYQAGKLVEGGMSPESREAFAAQCAGFVHDSTRRAFDETVARNVERDAGKGVRYARVTTGAETCTFCVMVASRGYAYSSATSAGGNGHKYHRGCDCYVVPGKAGSTTVEGVDLEELKRRWHAFEDIDARTDLTAAQRRAMKKDMLGADGRSGVSVEIDEMTPCLRRVSDGAIVSTTHKVVDPSTLDLREWDFDWLKERYEGNTVEALYVEGDDRVQGLVSYREDKLDKAVYVSLVESAPFNRLPIDSRDYVGVGGHLFAIAAKYAVEETDEPYMYFTAKTRLIDYYARELGAAWLFGQRMAMDETRTRALYQRYFGGR